jgi:hypothetical protein
VTKVTRNNGYVRVSATEAITIDDAYQQAQNIMKNERFVILSAENEEKDAEIFFARYADLAGSLRMKPGPCDGDLTMRTVYDPLGAPRKGRN